MGDFKDLRVWQSARALVRKLYDITNAFPDDERYRLVSQIRRAAVSVVANIAESTGRSTDPDQNRLLDTAMGSLRELEAHLVISMDMGFIEPNAGADVLKEVTSIQRQLARYIQAKRRPKSQVPRPTS